MRLIVVPPELLHVHDRLENWGRWARNDHVNDALLGSAEADYKREGVLHNEEERLRPVVSVDPHDASRVDRVIAPANGFPWKWSRMLKAAYVSLAPREVVCRVGRIPARDLDIELRRALAAADNRLRQRG